MTKPFNLKILQQAIINLLHNKEQVKDARAKRSAVVRTAPRTPSPERDEAERVRADDPLAQEHEAERGEVDGQERGGRGHDRRYVAAGAFASGFSAIAAPPGLVAASRKN